MVIFHESIIIIRENEEKVNCLFNVCRHRGSHICLEDEGRVRKLICPYHAWGYDLKGNLINAKMMDENFKSEDWSLKKCHSRVFEGLVFINLSENPCCFKDFINPIKPFIKLHGLGRAKIADRKIYPTKGNWKLALDNFHECYHCQPSHPEYCHVHSRDYIQSYGAGSNSGPESKEFIEKLIENITTDRTRIEMLDESLKIIGDDFADIIRNHYKSAERLGYSPKEMPPDSSS